MWHCVCGGGGGWIGEGGGLTYTSSLYGLSMYCNGEMLGKVTFDEYVNVLEY